MWTKERYLAWVTTRDPSPHKWDYWDCKQADAHIKSVTLDAFDAWAEANVQPEPLREYVKLMVRCSYGCMETDRLLVELDCFPDYVK